MCVDLNGFWVVIMDIKEITITIVRTDDSAIVMIIIITLKMIVLKNDGCFLQQ